MIAIHFPEANATFGPPPDLHENQVRRIAVYTGTIERGSCEGATMCVSAWQPTAEELADLNAGRPVFLAVLGGLPPHFLSTRFQDAINVA